MKTSVKYTAQWYKLTEKLVIIVVQNATLSPFLTITLLSLPYSSHFYSVHHVQLSRTITKHIKRQNTQFEEKEQASEQNMSGKLKLSEWEFKTIISMLRDLMEKADSMQVQIGNVSKQMEILEEIKKL